MAERKMEHIIKASKTPSNESQTTS